MILFLLLMVPWTLALSAFSAKETLDALPQEDREALNSLFYELVEMDHFGYAIFGSKAISLYANSVLTPKNSFCGLVSSGIFWEKWRVWKKYENLFPIKKYLIIEEAGFRYEGTVDIIIINKEVFCDVVDKHLEIFRKYLGKDVTSNYLLEKIERERKFVATINDHEILWGILLGFGTHNSALYHRHDMLDRYLYPDTYLYDEPSKDPTLFLMKEVILLEEHKRLDAQLGPCGEYGYSPLVICSPHFMADANHPETQELRSKYKKERGRISAKYAAGDFLQVTLEELTREI